MGTGVIALIVVVAALIAALPRWPHSRRWGYFPTSMLSVVAIAVLVLVLMGKM